MSGERRQPRRHEFFLPAIRDGLHQDIDIADRWVGTAATSLAALMSALSEQHFAATWLNSLEYDLWACLVNGPTERFPITERQQKLMRLLVEECNGWWMYPVDDPDAVLTFVTLDEWQRHIETVWVHPGGFVERDGKIDLA